jgi:hypothetical protein
MWGALSDEGTGLPFTITAGPRQRYHSWVWVPRESWPYFTLSVSRLPQPGGPGPRIYIPQEQGDPVITPGTGFPFRRLLRLAGLRWRYWNSPPRREVSLIFSMSGFTWSYTANMFILMIPYDLCLFPAQFYYISIYIWKIKSCVHIADRCAPWSCFKSKSKSHCDWRSVSQSVLVSSPLWGSWPDIYYSLTVTVLSLWGALNIWLNLLYSSSMDRTENTAHLLQCSCCFVMAWRIPLLPAQPLARISQKTSFFCCCLLAAA